MDKIKIVEVKEDILLRNSTIGNELREELKKQGIFLLNVMSSPGSGKTTLLVNLINKLKGKYNIGVIEADLDSDVDAYTIKEKTGVRVMQMHTGGACHLTAQMVRDAINEFDLKNLNLVILENVGNLVCPAEFDTGSHANMVLLSVPEGDDKPLKYPLMFEVASFVVITKKDVAPVFDFDFDKVKDNIHLRNKKAEVFVTSALNDDNVDEVANHLTKLLDNF